MLKHLTIRNNSTGDAWIWEIVDSETQRVLGIVTPDGQGFQAIDVAMTKAPSMLARSNVLGLARFGRRMLQITPEMQKSLGQWLDVTNFPGQRISIGLTARQPGMTPGIWLQFYSDKQFPIVK